MNTYEIYWNIEMYDQPINLLLSCWNLVIGIQKNGHDIQWLIMISIMFQSANCHWGFRSYRDSGRLSSDIPKLFQISSIYRSYIDNWIQLIYHYFDKMLTSFLGGLLNATMKCLLQALFRNGVLTAASSSQICRALGPLGWVTIPNWPYFSVEWSIVISPEVWG